MKFSNFILAVILMAAMPSLGNGAGKTPVDYVNPNIGNISHLLVPTYPMTHLPGSMLRVHPLRENYTGDLLNGLPGVMTSHRGRTSFIMSPWQGSLDGIGNIIPFSYDSETVKPYYYEVYLDDMQATTVRFAPSHQSAIYEINYGEQSGRAHLLVNSRRGELVAEGNTVSGYEMLTRNTKVYIYLETKQRPSGVAARDNDGVMSVDKSNAKAEGDNIAMVLQFGDGRQTVNVRYGISFISVEQAKKNLHREISDYNVDNLAARGRDIWNDALGRINVEGPSDNDKAAFYTALYRINERPINISEDGRYWSAFDAQVHEDGGSPFYTDDWIWDTYHATHPLRVLIEPGKQTDIIRSLLTMAQQSKPRWMPTFPEVTGDSHRMNGNHGVAVVWDAFMKGLTGFDLEAAYEACKGAMTEKSLIPWSRRPLTQLDHFYNEHGFFPGLDKDEEEYVPELINWWERRQSVAVTLAMCFDDWCLSQIAEHLGKTEDAEYFRRRSYNYRNLYNSQTAFFHPKNKDGEFITPFDYRFDAGPGARDYYDENNAYTYRWQLEFNVADLIDLMGGRDKFVANLDQTFREPLGIHISQFWSFMGDQTGNVGQFTMANEPSMHIPYLYNYAGQPWKTQKRVRTLLKQWFRNDLMGVPGDEDGGGLSSFVAFSMMGFYPVTPGSPTYNIGSPVFESITVDLTGGKKFVITARNCSAENKYIQSATLNGQQWNKPWFSHADIADGGTLVLVMGPKANKAWGAAVEDAPPSGYPAK